MAKEKNLLDILYSFNKIIKELSDAIWGVWAQYGSLVNFVVTVQILLQACIMTYFERIYQQPASQKSQQQQVCITFLTKLCKSQRD